MNLFETVFSKPLFRAGLNVAALLIVSAATLSPAQSKVLARVDGVEITVEDVRLAADDMGGGIPPEMEGAEREAYVIDYLIDMRLVARKAQADKFGEDAEFAKRLALLRDKALMEVLLGKVGRDAATEAELKKVYDTAASSQPREPEMRARHILVETEALAKTALRRVRAGEDFARVADELSKDPGSKGGDLGWFAKERMVPEFGEAADKMKPGQISEPVKTQFGWHVIKLEERREKPFPPLAEVREQVERYVVQKAQSELILALRAAAKIDREPLANAPAANPAAKR
jgi:peptidyl-prolyl cis-trans isomerase C